MFPISIHAPRAGSDGPEIVSTLADGQFQSTLPVRGATLRCCAPHRSPGYFNPRSPCGERRAQNNICKAVGCISIHAPRAGSDRQCPQAAPLLPYFNPRSPCGERLRSQLLRADGRAISIHAPRAGSDEFAEVEALDGANFNPRSPCGERRDKHMWD